MVEVTECVEIAINYISSLFRDSTNVGLEEINFNESSKCWDLTIGFSRPWNLNKPSTLASLKGEEPKLERDYKIVSVSSATGKVESVNIRKI